MSLRRCGVDMDRGLRLGMTISHIELELLLVRHGQTKWNAEHRYLGQTDIPLLPDAVEQLSQLKQQLSLLTEKPSYEGQGFDKQQYNKQQSSQQACEYTDRHVAGASGGFWRVFCSDLLRCRETLAYIAPTLEKVTVYDQRLREMNFGAWEGCTYEQLKDNPLYRSWIDDPSMVTPPEGESWEQFEERLLSFLSDLGQAVEAAFGDCMVIENKGEVIKNELDPLDPLEQLEIRIPTKFPPQRVLIVTHGGVIRNLLAQIVPGVTFYNAVAPSPGTVMVLKVHWQNGRWSADISEN